MADFCYFLFCPLFSRPPLFFIPLFLFATFLPLRFLFSSSFVFLPFSFGLSSLDFSFLGFLDSGFLGFAFSRFLRAQDSSAVL
ncbi:hypothetical protein BKN38_05690 [Helicobacter sp. CLO-3]|nr:hypothetical protein BKN38_05690 [Helicobacter sp. CLO-3]